VTPGPRETSGATTCLVARYVRAHGGDEALAAVHRASAIDAPIEALEDERRWFTYEEKIALFEAAADVLGDPDVTRHMGQTALAHEVGAGLRVLLRTLGSPRTVLANVAKACPKFSTVASMELLEIGRNRAAVSYELRADKLPHRLDCAYNQGLISVIGPLFGLPLLAVDHPECQVLGAPRCIYRVHWPRHRVFGRRRVREASLIDQSQALATQLEGLQSTAADLVSADDVSEVLDRIVARAGVAVSAPRYLLAVHDENDHLIVRADGFTSQQEAEAIAEHLVHGQVRGDRVLSHSVASARRDYGVLAAFYDDHSFFDYERRLLAAYARNAAAALDVAGALDDANRSRSETAALLQLANDLAELASPEEVAQQVAQAMQPVMAAHSTVVFLIEDGNVIVRGLAGAVASSTLITIGSRIAVDHDEDVRAWLEYPQPSMMHADTSNRIGRKLLAQFTADWFLVVPIRRRNQLLGICGATFVTEPANSSELISRSVSVADHAAIALDNASLLARFAYQALHDDLTHLASRRHFEEGAARSLARAARDDVDVSLVFIDLDGFKAVNDQHGHIIGDQVLCEVARRVERHVRQGDLVGRLGGDEFGLLFWNCGPDDALPAAERVRHALEEPIHLNNAIQVSASIGVATAVGGRSLYPELLRRCDDAMYRAKRAGRNVCVVVGSE
jgi:diguanylate cyclase (GGDEF)-like protein